MEKNVKVYICDRCGKEQILEDNIIYCWLIDKESNYHLCHDCWTELKEKTISALDSLLYAENRKALKLVVDVLLK